MRRSKVRRAALGSSLALMMGTTSLVSAYAQTATVRGVPQSDGFEFAPAGPSQPVFTPQRSPETPGANGFELLPAAPGAQAKAEPAAPAALASRDGFQMVDAPAALTVQDRPVQQVATNQSAFTFVDPARAAGPRAVAYAVPTASLAPVVQTASFTPAEASGFEFAPATLTLASSPKASPALLPVAYAQAPSVALEADPQPAPAVDLHDAALAAASSPQAAAGLRPVVFSRAPSVLVEPLAVDHAPVDVLSAVFAAASAPMASAQLRPVAFVRAPDLAIDAELAAPTVDLDRQPLVVASSPNAVPRLTAVSFVSTPRVEIEPELEAVAPPISADLKPAEFTLASLGGATDLQTVSFTATPQDKIEFPQAPAPAVRLALRATTVSPAPSDAAPRLDLVSFTAAPNVQFEAPAEPAAAISLSLQPAVVSWTSLQQAPALQQVVCAPAPAVQLDAAAETFEAPALVADAGVSPVSMRAMLNAESAVYHGGGERLAVQKIADTEPLAPTPPAAAADPRESADYTPGPQPLASPLANPAAQTEPSAPVSPAGAPAVQPPTPPAQVAPPRDTPPEDKALPPPADTAPPAPTAQDQAAAAEPAPVAAPIVGRIIVQGNERIEPATITSYLPVQVGDQIDAARIDLAVKTLFRTDLFSDVSIEMQGTDLIVKVAENPIINQVVFEGNKSIKEDKLRDEVTIRPRGIFTRTKVEQDVQRIIELYRRSGRISATVSPKIVQLPQKRVDLIFEISEGPKSGILDINFVGNKSFSDKALSDVIITRETHWYKFFGSNDNYDPDRIEYDREQIRKFYRNHGYYDFRIVSAVAELAPNKNGFVVTYTIDEGPKYHFGKLKVQTDLKRLNGDLLQALLPIREGQLYQDDRIEKATDALTYAAGANGFAFVDIRPRYVAHPETKTVDVTFDIKEGPRVYIERIDVVGNNQTLDRVVRREMRVSEGDAYNRVLVDRSKNQIKALGFFKDVDIEQLPGSAPDKTILRVKVTEQPTGELTFSLGYSSVEKLIGNVGVTQRNFRGRGQTVDLQVELGYVRKTATFSFTEPRFLGRNLAAGFDIYTYRYNYSSTASFQSASTGVNLRTGFPINQYASVGLRYGIHTDKVSIPSYIYNSTTGQCASGYSQSLCDEIGTSFTSAVSWSLRWDRRNDPINPTRGYYLDFGQDFAGVGGNVQYIRTTTDGAWYYGFNPQWILSFQGSAGYIEGWGGDVVRINDRFFRGGDSFRGFEIAGIGPRDVSSTTSSAGVVGDALGGKLFGIGTVELTLPTVIPKQYGIKSALFTDFGTLGVLDDRVKRNPDGTLDTSIRDGLVFRQSAGISIFWKSPMGPLQFDFSKVLKQAPYDRKETFRFSTSTRF